MPSTCAFKVLNEISPLCRYFFNFLNASVYLNLPFRVQEAINKIISAADHPRSRQRMPFLKDSTPELADSDELTEFVAKVNELFSNDKLSTACSFQFGRLGDIK